MNGWKDLMGREMSRLATRFRVRGAQAVAAKNVPKISVLEETLAQQIHALKLPAPLREFRFDAIRKWRFDFAWKEKKLAVECEGITFRAVAGRHQRAEGFSKDCEKYNTAQMQGWVVLRFTQPMVKSGEAIKMISEALNA